MPLVRLELRNEFGLGDPELYRGAAAGIEGSKAVLNGVAVAGLVGILRQLGDVIELGAEIFHDLHEQVMTTSARGQRMLARIRKIEETLPSIEDAIRGKGSYIDLAYETGSDWRSKIKITDRHLFYNNFPQFMMDSYEECRDPPRLYLLDKYDRAGTGACLKRYSDSSYFKRAWATSESEKAQQIQKGKKFQKNKRKYSRLAVGETQGLISRSQYKSLATRASSAHLGNVDQKNSAENLPTTEIRSKPEILTGPQILSTMSKLNCTKQVSEVNPSVIPNDLEYDSLSVSNVQNNQDDPNVSKLHSNELVISVNDDSQYDFMHRKSTSGSPSVVWDEADLMKPAGLKYSNGTLQDLKLLSMNSESSKVDEPARNLYLDKAKPLPINSYLPRSSCDKKQFELDTEVDCYMDAFNTLESEAETDSECQTKCIQTLSNNGHQKNEFGVAKLSKKYLNSSIEFPLELLDSSNKYVLPMDPYLDVSRTPELKQSTQEAGVSAGLHYDGSHLSINSVVTMFRTKDFQEIDNDQPRSNEVKSETTEAASSIHISPQISISNIPSIKLWSNGNLLGLQPSKPPDIYLPNGAGESTEFNSLNTGVKSEKENILNGQRSQHLNSSDEVVGPLESLSLADQRILNSNQFLSRKYKENNSMKHSSTYLDCHYDGFCAKQNSQEQSEAMSFSQCEGSQVASPSVFFTRTSQVDQTTGIASSMETESYRSSNVASQSMDSLHHNKCLSPSFSGLPQRKHVQGRQIKPLVTHTKRSLRYDLNASNSRSEGKLLADNGVASQTFYEQNLASRTSDEQNLINNTKFRLLEKSISSSSHYSQMSSPPLEHMKISFHPINIHKASNLKLEVPDGCISQKIDGKVFPSSQLFPGCTLPAQQGNSESDDDTFCRSYPYSTEDLLSCSDSNSDLWEQDDCSVSKINAMSDDLRRISSSRASISSYSGFEHMNHVSQEIGMKDIFTGNDTLPFQPGYIANIPSLESLISHVKHDSLSISTMNAATLAPTELPPPPPLPPIRWRLLRPSYEISEDNYSRISQLVNHFEDPLNQNLPTPAKNENIIRRSLPLGEDGQHKKLQDKQKIDSLLQTDLSLNPCELDRRARLFYQIRDRDIQHKFKPCEESKSQVSTGNGVEEREDLLHQIRIKTFNLRRAATAKPFSTQSTTNDKVSAILEKVNAIRQACASSDEAADSDEWNDA